MNSNNKILISAILIIGLAMFASSLSSDISGRATGSCTAPSASVTPKTIAAGEVVELTIKGEFAMPIDIFEGGRRVESFRRAEGCSGNTCDGGTIRIQTIGGDRGTWMDGTYCPKVRDLCTKVGGLKDRVVLGGCFQVKGYIDKWGNLQP